MLQPEMLSPCESWVIFARGCSIGLAYLAATVGVSFAVLLAHSAAPPAKLSALLCCVALLALGGVTATAAAWHTRAGRWVVPLWGPLVQGGLVAAFTATAFGELFAPAFWVRLSETQTFSSGLLTTVALMWLVSPLVVLAPRVLRKRPAVRWAAALGGGFALPLVASGAMLYASF